MDEYFPCAIVKGDCRGPNPRSSVYSMASVQGTARSSSSSSCSPVLPSALLSLSLSLSLLLRSSSEEERWGNGLFVYVLLQLNGKMTSRPLCWWTRLSQEVWHLHKDGVPGERGRGRACSLNEPPHTHTQHTHNTHPL